MPEQIHTTSMTSIKNASYLLTFVASIEWLGLDPRVVSIFAILMVLDVVTGVLRAYSIDGGRTVKSAILKRGVVAKMLILIALFSVALAGKGVGFDMGALVQAAVNVLILGELYSILGNIHSIRTGKQKVEFDAISFILGRIKELLQKAVK